MESLGQYIKHVRKLTAMTQDQLARTVGITKAYVCIIERGDKTGRDVAVSPAKLEALAQALQVPAEELFNRAGILPAGTRLVRVADASSADDNAQFSSECEELNAAGYGALSSAARDEVKRFIAKHAGLSGSGARVCSD